jgi:CrcB protein
MSGGAIGAGLRYGVGLVAPARDGQFPWATFAVNLAGSLLAGLLIGVLVSRGEEAERWRLLLGVGLLGGFTTFSAFTAETGALLQRGELGAAFLYVGASVGGGLALLFAGLWLARVSA